MRKLPLAIFMALLSLCIIFVTTAVSADTSETSKYIVVLTDNSHLSVEARAEILINEANNAEIGVGKNKLGSVYELVFKGFSATLTPAAVKSFIANFAEVAEVQPDEILKIPPPKATAPTPSQSPYPNESKLYQIKPKHARDKCIDIHEGNGNAYQHDCHGGDNQLFELTSTEDGYHQIQPKHAKDECLDIHGDNGNIYKHRCHGGDNQKFKLKSTEGDYYQIVSKHDDSMCVDVNQDSHNIYVHSCHEGENQQFKFVEKPKPLLKPTKAVVGADDSDYNWGQGRISQRDLPLNYAMYNPAATGLGTDVYIVDTGIRKSHREFQGRVKQGFNFADNNNDTGDCSGHGTHIASTVGGFKYGVAKDANLYPLKVSTGGCNGGEPKIASSNVLGALEWIATHYQQDKGAVVNMSFGRPVGFNAGFTLVERGVIALVQKGITVVAAAGNRNKNACDYAKSRLRFVITVGSTDPNDDRSSFSNFGDCVDILAPGRRITGASHKSDTAIVKHSGTSMAAPHVAAAVAIYLQAHPQATPAQVKKAIINNATEDRIDMKSFGDGFYPIQSEQGCLDTHVENYNIYLHSCHGEDNQKFALVPVKGGYYQIKPKHDDSMCVDVNQDSHNIYVHICHGGDNQQFALTPVGGGYYQLESKLAGKCVEINANNNNAYLDHCSVEKNQKFKREIMDPKSVTPNRLLYVNFDDHRALWQDPAPFLPQAPVSTNPADYTEEHYGCHAFLIKTDIDDYSVAFTVRRGEKVTQETRTRIKPMLRFVYYFFRFEWVRKLVTEEYTMNVNKVVSQDCAQSDNTISFVDGIKPGDEFNLKLDNSSLLKVHIHSVVTYAEGPVEYRIIRFWPSGQFGYQDGAPLKFSTLKEGPKIGGWRRINTVVKESY